MLHVHYLHCNFFARAHAAKKPRKTPKSLFISSKGKGQSAQTNIATLDNTNKHSERNRKFQVFNEKNHPEKGRKQGFYCKVADSHQITTSTQQ